MTRYLVAALYKFTRFDNPEVLIPPLREFCNAQKVKGTLLLAREGINGTIAGSVAGIEKVLDQIRALPGCSDLEHKQSFCEEMPFLRMKVRLKSEIVTLGAGDIDPNHAVGTYVDLHDWNALIAQDDVVVIDTRNDYEVEVGTFKGAVDPQTASFGEFPKWWADNKAAFEGKKVAMFCTGGIRCEKATSYLLQEGVEDVFHLKGGILKYLEHVPKQQSTWEGECFVFDQRVTVGHGLVEGTFDLCFACRQPITKEQSASLQFELGVSCPRCVDVTSEDQKNRFRERQKQVALSLAKGEQHIGS